MAGGGGVKRHGRPRKKEERGRGKGRVETENYIWIGYYSITVKKGEILGGEKSSLFEGGSSGGELTL